MGSFDVEAARRLGERGIPPAVAPWEALEEANLLLAACDEIERLRDGWQGEAASDAVAFAELQAEVTRLRSLLTEAEEALERLCEPTSSPKIEEAALVQIEVAEIARAALARIREEK